MPAAYDVAAAGAEEQIRTIGYGFLHEGRSLILMLQLRGLERRVKVSISDDNADIVADFPLCFLETDVGSYEISKGQGDFPVPGDFRFRLRMEDGSEIVLKSIE